MTREAEGVVSSYTRLVVRRVAWLVLGLSACAKPGPPPTAGPASPAVVVPESVAVVPMPLEPSLVCAPAFCEERSWVGLSFHNPGTAPRVLEVAEDPDAQPRWHSVTVSAEWDDGSGFGSASFGGVCGSAHGACWSGSVVELEAGATETFDLVFGETRDTDVTIDVDIRWRESPTRDANDATEHEGRWRVAATVTGALAEGCVPVTCTVTERS